MTKIQDQPADTVAQWVEHRRDKPWAWVRILASVIFFICSVVFRCVCYPGEALAGPFSTDVCKKLNNVNSNNDIQICKITILCIYIRIHSVFQHQR